MSANETRMYSIVDETIAVKPVVALVEATSQAQAKSRYMEGKISASPASGKQVAAAFAANLPVLYYKAEPAQTADKT